VGRVNPGKFISDIKQLLLIRRDSRRAVETKHKDLGKTSRNEVEQRAKDREG